MTKPSQVSYQTIGTNKNRPRLWIEGVKLGAAGFTRGARYDLRFCDGIMLVTLSKTGARVVSGKMRNDRDIPVLDLCMRDLENQFGPQARVRVVFTEGEIKVSLHHETAAQGNRETRFRAALCEGTLREASMFTGGGISTHAIHRAIEDHGHRARLAWVVDANLRYLQSGYANNYAIDDDTTALIGRAEEIESAFFEPVDILSFSMPCSGFSKAGKSKHGKDPEQHDGAAALFGTMNAIRAANPAVLISENVVEARTSAAYALLKSELSRLGYEIFERVMTSADTGSIENRTRYWFVAISRGLADGFSFENIMHPKATAPARRIRDILEADIAETAWSQNAYLKEKALRDAADGKGFSRQLLTGEETSCGVIGRHYNKRRSTEPFLQRADGTERLFTPIEHARLKSAPDELVAGLNPTLAHEILGQSVDYRQAWLAMAAVMAHVTGHAITATRRVAKVATRAAEIAGDPTVPTGASAPKQLSLF